MVIIVMKNTSFMITRLKNPQFSEKIYVLIEIAFRDELLDPGKGNSGYIFNFP